jgi:ATP-dependent DNA helicase RecG
VARVCDGSGDDCILHLRFLSFYGSQQRALAAACEAGQRLRIFGEIRHGFLGLEMVHPRYRIVTADEALPQALTPVYPTTAGVGQGTPAPLITRAVANADLAELLDADWCGSHSLPPFAERRFPAACAAARQCLRPRSRIAQCHPAWRRIKFDELLAQQISLRRAYLARRCQGAPVLAASGALGASGSKRRCRSP